jgi:hypothetical protein
MLNRAEYEAGWDSLSEALDVFKRHMLLTARRVVEWRDDLVSHRASYADTIPDMLLRYRFAVREGELILERAAALADQAPRQERAVTQMAVAGLRAIIDPWIDAVTRSQDIAGAIELSDEDKQVQIFSEWQAATSKVEKGLAPLREAGLLPSAPG